jgi:ribosome maturation factor RimP
MLDARSVGSGAGRAQPRGVGFAPRLVSWKEVDVVNENGAESPVLARVRELVQPIASDLGLDVYDVEQRGGVLRVALDTPPDSGSGITLDTLALASRLVSRELDHHDPVPGRYTLEVTSPGVERSLRTPDHFRREVGKVVAIRLSDVVHDDRRVTGTLVAADDRAATVRVDGPDGPVERTVPYPQIDRARTVFEWGPAAKTKRKENT